MPRPKLPTYSLKGQNGEFYSVGKKRKRLFETKGYALATAMAIVAEKETGQPHRVITRIPR